MAFLPTAKDRVSIIAGTDAAIDWAASDVEGYVTTLDESHLTIRADAEPTRYLLAAPSRWAAEWLMAETAGEGNAGLAGLAYLRACLREVTGPHAVSEADVDAQRVRTHGISVLPMDAPVLLDADVVPVGAAWHLGMIAPMHLALTETAKN